MSLKFNKVKMFQKTLNWLIKKLTEWERNKSSEYAYYKLRLSLERKIHSFPKNETALFFRLLDLYSLKQKRLLLGKINPLKSKFSSKYIGFLGPLGVGKSTIAQVLVNKLKAEHVVKEPHRKNPFWQKSQGNSIYMLRSQVYFLISNIYSDMDAKLKAKISISDTSTLTDILMWANWYSEIGHFKKKEYQTYQKLVNLLKEIIPKPNLLIVLLPNSVENLYQGIRERQKNEPWRKNELVFSEKDLYLQTKKVTKISKKITKDWKVPVLTITVDPLLLHQSPHLQKECLEKIRRITE